MKVLLFILMAFLSFSLHAQSKADISQMLDKLHSSGVFTQEQVDAARAQLSEMNEQEIQNLVQEATKKVGDPKVQEKLRKMK